MKNILYLSLLILIACLPGVAECQSPTNCSRTRTLQKPRGEDVFVRFFGGNGDMLVHNYDMSAFTSVFTCRQTPTHPTANRYEIPIPANVYGPMSFRVLDMVVVGDMCFFCGRKRHAVGIEYGPDGNPYTVYVDRGFVGQVSLNHITDSPSGTANYRLTDLPDTKELTRIDVKVDPDVTSDTMLALVGTSTAGQSCLAFVNAGSGPWCYKVVTPTDATETFSDVVFTETYVTATSRYAGNSYLFGMRSAMINDIFVNNYYSDLDMVNTFNTSAMVNVVTNINTTMQSGHGIIQLSPVPGTDEVNVGYESIALTPSGNRENHTTLFLMDVYMPGNTYILNLQDVRSGVDGHGTFADMLTMKERNGVALLHRSTTGQPPRSVVQFASWATIGLSFSYAAPDDEELTSIDKYGKDLLWAAGHRPDHQDSVVLFNQNLACPFVSCYTEIYPLAAPLAEMVKPDTEEKRVNVERINLEYVIWNSLNAAPTMIEQRCHAIGRDTDGSGEEGDDGEEENDDE